MSTELRVRTPRRLQRSLLDHDIADLTWSEGEPTDPLRPGSWGLFRDRVSTRITTVAYASRTLTVTIRAGACAEDCDLALGIARRVASAGNGRVETTDAGTLTIDQLGEVFDGDWLNQQLESAARVSIHLAQDRGRIAVPGPTREVWIGPRVISELQDGDPTNVADRLVGVMRRVLWPDPRYESAAKFTSTGPDGDSFTLAMLLPDRPCVLPHSDRMAIDDPNGIFMVPRDALESLPLQTTLLDDGNHLVEAVPVHEWPELCRVARAFELAT